MSQQSAKHAGKLAMKQYLTEKFVIQAHLSSHAGVESLAQQALLSRHHPCQIDRTAWQRPTTSATTATATSGSTAYSPKTHGSGELGPVDSHGKHAMLEPAANRSHDKHCKRPEPGVSTPKKLDRKPLQELQPGQALSAFAAACLSSKHADRSQADQLPRQPVQQEQANAQTAGDKSNSHSTNFYNEDLQPPSGLAGCKPPELGSFADRDPVKHMQWSGQRSAHEDSAASIDRACESHDGSIEPKEAPKQQPEKRPGGHYQGSLDLIDIFQVGSKMIFFSVRDRVSGGVIDGWMGLQAPRNGQFHEWSP